MTTTKTRPRVRRTWTIRKRRLRKQQRKANESCRHVREVNSFSCRRRRRVIPNLIPVRGDCKSLYYKTSLRVSKVCFNCDLFKKKKAESKRSASKSPVKRAGPSTTARQSSAAGGRSTQNSSSASNATGNKTGQAPYNRGRATKERECPLAGCDSRGHLSGKFESHFTLEACPLYHNTTPQACM